MRHGEKNGDIGTGALVDGVGSTGLWAKVMFKDRWKKFREGIQIFRKGSSHKGCKGKMVSSMSQEHTMKTVMDKGHFTETVVATRPEEQGVRIWRALETFIGISDFVLSATFIGALLLEI